MPTSFSLIPQWANHCLKVTSSNSNSLDSASSGLSVKPRLPNQVVVPPLCQQLPSHGHSAQSDISALTKSRWSVSGAVRTTTRTQWLQRFCDDH